MLLDLREIIGIPGSTAEFDYEPDLSDAAEGSVMQITAAKASGSIYNRAGALTLTATVDALCLCVCARCLKEFERTMHQDVSANLSEGGEDGDDPDSYLIQDDRIDVDEIIVTEFVLEMDETVLCDDDCAGLCENCGADLNEESCTCVSDIDPRLSILGQLLEDDD